MDMQEKRRLEIGQRLMLTVKSLNRDFWGQARLGSKKKAIIPGAWPGEIVEAEVVRVWPRYVLMKLVEVLQPHPARVTPQCRHYGSCAGCQFQSLGYEEQLKIKIEKFLGYFQAVNYTEPLPDLEIVPAVNPYGYRNSITLHGPGEPGFWQVKGAGMERIEECAISVPAINDALKRERAEKFERFLSAGEDNIMFRADNTGGVYVGPELYKPGREMWLNERLCNPLTGEFQDLQVQAHAFWQANTPMLETLLGLALRPLLDRKPEVLIEAYCGVGIFGLMAAAVLPRVIGVEENPQAIVAAKRNIEKLGYTHHEVVCGKTEDFLAGFLEKSAGQDVTLLVDPPRSGLSKDVLKILKSSPPRRLVYVSCGPATLAENLKTLADVYAVNSLAAIDMFPQTRHIEAVAHLERKA